MIRCSHCGKLAPAGAMSCQSCGMPLANDASSVASAGQAAQQELPAWLESLRTQEKPAPSNLSKGTEGPQPFTMDELVDENFMPRWMLQDQSHMADGGYSGPVPAVAQPESGPARQTFPNSGLEASSLIDERALPSWMRGPQESAQPGFGQGFSAQSLVDQQALPPWIKELGQATQPPMPTYAVEQRYALPPQPPITPPSLASVPPPFMPQTPPVPMRPEPQIPMQTPQGFSAHDLLDQQALPGWLSQEEHASGFQQSHGSGPTGSGFGAGELIERQSMPQWMRQQGQERSDPASALGMPVNGSGQMMGMGQRSEGGPASMDVDQNTMPAWPQQGPGPMAAGSLIDEEALPGWLRNANAPQQQQQQPGPQPMASPNGRVRNEGMRVPSRPRSGSGAHEQSEMAANIFSSLLGVSASTPVMPGQAPMNTLGVAQGQSAQTGQPVTPGWQPANQTAQPQAWQMAEAHQTLYAPGNTGGTQSGAQQPAYALSAAGPQTGGPVPNATGTGKDQPAPAKKRGFFEIIRDFFK